MTETTAPTQATTTTPAIVPEGATALVEKHRDALTDATAALEGRSFHSRYNESPSPKVHGEDAAPNGLKAHEAHLGQKFSALESQPSTGQWVGSDCLLYTSPSPRD